MTQQGQRAVSPETTTTTTSTAGTSSLPMSVAALRRSSARVTPTRTLLLSEQEHRAVTPTTTTSSLFEPRPRSNPRTRTPRRQESPLDPDVFRRRNDGEATSRTQRARPITEVPVSRKQGPSHRKLRRWRNDHFDDLAQELAAGGTGGQEAATALRRAKDTAHLYRDVVNLAADESSSNAMMRFLKEDQYKVVRDQFFEGELPRRPTRVSQPTGAPLTGHAMFYRVDLRLRRIAVQACRHSPSAAVTVKTMEAFLVTSFGPTPPEAGPWWSTLWRQRPTVTHHADGQRTLQFLFDATSDQGGYHRLLLHALCQFHGLAAVSTNLVASAADGPARSLRVTGAPVLGRAPRLLRQIIPDTADEVPVLEEPWTTLTEEEAHDSWEVVEG